MDTKTTTRTEFILAIDTTEHAGSFEREMCAFCTGQVGECEIGSKQADAFNAWYAASHGDGNPFDVIVDLVMDDTGILRPCVKLPTPGRWSDGLGRHFDDADLDPAKGQMKYPALETVGIYFNSRPSQRLRDIVITRAWEFCQNYRSRAGHNGGPIGIRGFRLITRTTQTVVTDVALDLSRN